MEVSGGILDMHVFGILSIDVYISKVLRLIAV